jgi:arylsulfatase B
MSCMICLFGSFVHNRASLLTGRHVIHTGAYTTMQYEMHGHLVADHLDDRFTLLPTYLKRCCGYESHMVGKWHLGANAMSSLPTSRGFDSFFGFWYGGNDHFTHALNPSASIENGRTCYDAVDGDVNEGLRYNGSWSTSMLTQRAVDIIHDHADTMDQSDASEQIDPFFLYLAFTDSHAPVMAEQVRIRTFVSRYLWCLLRSMIPRSQSVSR